MIMKNEIEFRAWTWTSMLYKEGMYGLIFCEKGIGVHVAVWDQCYLMPDEIELMQYTGLKDKNGRKIFEWDILSIDFQGYHNYEVFKNHRKAKWELKEIWREWFGAKNFNIKGITFTKDKEVIGNIYENPSLLTK